MPTAMIIAGHGAFLAACGIYGSWSNGWTPKVMHSAYAGVGSAAGLAACAGLAIAPSRKLYMIGVHVALLLQVAFTGVFSVQAFRSYGKPDNRFPLFVVMAAGSMAALGAMRAAKPKKPKNP